MKYNHVLNRLSELMQNRLLCTTGKNPRQRVLSLYADEKKVSCYGLLGKQCKTSTKIFKRYTE